MEPPGLRLVPPDSAAAPPGVSTGQPPGPPPPAAPPTSDGITFNLQGAADVCGVDPKTIRRRRDLLEQHGAQRNDDGSWTIPLGALLAAGLHPGKPAGPDSLPGAPPAQPELSPRRASPAATDIPAAAAEQIAHLERQLAEERAARLRAEQTAAERDRHNDDLRRALALIERQLTAAAPVDPAAATPAQTDPPDRAPTLATRPTTPRIEADPPKRGRWVRPFRRRSH